MKYESIEMIGLSGVGKTTLFYNADDPIFQNLEAYNTVEPIEPSRVSYLFEAFLLLIKTAISIGFIRSLSILRSRKYFNLYLKLGYRIAGINMRDLNGLVYLRDSGVLMPLISAVIDDRISPDDVLLHQILYIIPLPKYVYCMIDTPVDIYNRFISREKKLKKDIKGYALSDFEGANIFLFTLVEKLKDMNVNVVIIENKDNFFKKI